MESKSVKRRESDCAETVITAIETLQTVPVTKLRAKTRFKGNALYDLFFHLGLKVITVGVKAN